MINIPQMKVIGLMSGTSLDGLDLALVSFEKKETYQFKILCGETIPYSRDWKHKLSTAFYSGPDQLELLDEEYGIFLGEAILNFIVKYKFKPDLISSHGHTVFHKPQEGYTLQIGSGKKIRELTNIPVVNNFRIQDVQLGGQGAPLVPLGDELLFGEFDFCLNAGGFSNVSWKEEGRRFACDIGPCNIILNEICKRAGLDYDKDGNLSSQGNLIGKLLEKWNSLEYYKLPAPKSLGREWIEDNFLKDIWNENYEVPDLLATAAEHIVKQIDSYIKTRAEFKISKNGISHVLTTGGAAYNNYLVNKLQKSGNQKIQYLIPGSELIDYKEALVFALLGYLRWHNEVNVLASVTGASQDHSSGVIFQ